MINTTDARLERLERRRKCSREWHQRRHQLGRCHVASCGNDVQVNPDTGELFWKCRPCRIRESAQVAARLQRKHKIATGDVVAQDSIKGIGERHHMPGIPQSA